MHAKRNRACLTHFDGSRPASKPAQHDRSVGDVARMWSRVVGTPSEKIVDRSKDDLIQMKTSIAVFVCIASTVF